MKTLREIMRKGFLFPVSKEASVREATQVMTEHNVGIVAVLDGGALVGVFSERDVVRRVVHMGLSPDTTPVEQVMTKNLVVANEDLDYQAAMRMMDRANIRHLPVINDEHVVSMLSIRDLMRVDMERMGEEIRFLHEYLYALPATDIPTQH